MRIPSTPKQSVTLWLIQHHFFIKAILGAYLRDKGTSPEGDRGTSPEVTVGEMAWKEDMDGRSKHDLLMELSPCLISAQVFNTDLWC